MAEARSAPDEILHAAESPLVFCPLGFERRAYRRFGKLPTITTGPGAAAIRHAFAERDRWPVRNPRLVVLLGLAGALDPARRTGAASVVTHVRLAQGRLATAALAHRGGAIDEPATMPPADRRFEPSRTVAMECSAPIASPESKRALRAATGAHLVDTECSAFAECAEAARLPWTVVRGISDAAEDALPSEVPSFVDAAGETRIGRVLGAIARRPSLAPELVRLGRASRTAMRAASFLADAHACIPPIELCTPANPLLLYGGSFDPPHARHATLLAEAMRALASPCAILMPAQVNPLKSAAPPAPPDARLAMCRAAVADAMQDAADAFAGEVRLSRLELEREGPSYTVDTVEALIARHWFLAGAVRFLVGSDAIRGIERWSRWRTLLELARPAVVVRPPDARADVERFLDDFARTSGFTDAPSWLLGLPPVDLASTGIRAAIEGGERPEGLSDGVWDEIVARGLYGSGGAR